MPKLSVILCTHNPREGAIRRALDGLRNQGLDFDQWELLVIDNGSDPPLEGRLDLGWHPHGSVVVESQLGLTRARLRGIRSSIGDILVFVDDDNILRPNYLEEARRLAESCPMLGAWGGSTVGEYEQPPPDWFHRHAALVGVRTIERARWGNRYYDFSITPIGAGMVVRREVASAYAEKATTDPTRQDLDRKGGSLISGGDVDLANTAIDLGMGLGVFPILELVHLIPEGRTTLPYLEKLAKAIGVSQVVVRRLRPDCGETIAPEWWERRALEWVSEMRMPGVSRKLHRAMRRGRAEGLALVSGVGHTL